MRRRYNNTTCHDCGKLVLLKCQYAHIVIRHKRLPCRHEVPEAYWPLPPAMRRLLPHIEKIATEFVQQMRLRAEQ